MSRKPDQWMPLDVRKYLGDTMHLGREQHGAYMLLIMAYWMRGTALSDSDAELAAIVRASPTDWRRLRPVMEPFFIVREGKWFHKRIETELEKARAMIEKKSAAGKKGAENRWQTNGTPNGTGMADASQTGRQTAYQTDAPLPSPVPEERKQTLPAGAGVVRIEESGFEEFWKTYKAPPNSKKPEARKAWIATAKTRPALQDLLRAVEGYNAWLAEQSRAQRRDYPKQHPSTWLRGEVWNGFLGQADSTHSPEELAAILDRRDQLLRQGKYAPNYQ